MAKLNSITAGQIPLYPQNGQAYLVRDSGALIIFNEAEGAWCQFYLSDGDVVPTPVDEYKSSVGQKIKGSHLGGVGLQVAVSQDGNVIAIANSINSNEDFFAQNSDPKIAPLSEFSNASSTSWYLDTIDSQHDKEYINGVKIAVFEKYGSEWIVRDSDVSSFSENSSSFSIRSLSLNEDGSLITIAAEVDISSAGDELRSNLIVLAWDSDLEEYNSDISKNNKVLNRLYTNNFSIMDAKVMKNTLVFHGFYWKDNSSNVDLSEVPAGNTDVKYEYKYHINTHTGSAWQGSSSETINSVFSFQNTDAQTNSATFIKKYHQPLKSQVSEDGNQILLYCPDFSWSGFTFDQIKSPAGTTVVHPFANGINGGVEVIKEDQSTFSGDFNNKELILLEWDGSSFVRNTTIDTLLNSLTGNIFEAHLSSKNGHICVIEGKAIMRVFSKGSGALIDTYSEASSLNLESGPAKTTLQDYFNNSAVEDNLNLSNSPVWAETYIKNCQISSNGGTVAITYLDSIGINGYSRPYQKTLILYYNSNDSSWVNIGEPIIKPLFPSGVKSSSSFPSNFTNVAIPWQPRNTFLKWKDVYLSEPILNTDSTIAHGYSQSFDVYLDGAFYETIVWDDSNQRWQGNILYIRKTTGSNPIWQFNRVSDDYQLRSAVATNSPSQSDFSSGNNLWDVREQNKNLGFQMTIGSPYSLNMSGAVDTYNFVKLDSDGDGYIDYIDNFPTDPSEAVDSDGDGVGDNADVAPNDPNVSEKATAYYVFGKPTGATTGGYYYPVYLSTDGLSDYHTHEFPDGNGGIIDYYMENSEMNHEVDKTSVTEQDLIDLGYTRSNLGWDDDLDQIPNNIDTDDDGDGIPDASDSDHPDNAGEADVDGDGVIDSAAQPIFSVGDKFLYYGISQDVTEVNSDGAGGFNIGYTSTRNSSITENTISEDDSLVNTWVDGSTIDPSSWTPAYAINDQVRFNDEDYTVEEHRVYLLYDLRKVSDNTLVADVQESQISLPPQELAGSTELILQNDSRYFHGEKWLIYTDIFGTNSANAENFLNFVHTSGASDAYYPFYDCGTENPDNWGPWGSTYGDRSYWIIETEKSPTAHTGSTQSWDTNKIGVGLKFWLSFYESKTSCIGVGGQAEIWSPSFERRRWFIGEIDNIYHTPTPSIINNSNWRLQKAGTPGSKNYLGDQFSIVTKLILTYQGSSTLKKSDGIATATPFTWEQRAATPQGAIYLDNWTP